MRAAVQGNWQAISGKTYDWEEVDLSVDALEALGVIVCDSHDPSKEKALQILLRSRDRKVIKILLTAVGGLGWHLFGALKKIDPNWAEAEEARSAVPDLLFALKHGDPRYGGSAAARALGKIGDPRAVQPLCEALTTRGEWDTVRKLHLEAVCALGSIGDAKAVEPLVAAIRSQIDGAWGHEAAAETGCAWEAILALGEIGGPSADSLRVIEFPKTIAGRQLRAVADKTLAAMEANRSGPE
ncbi:MAG TPA: HEAT repeat domain-containing protein [Gemmatimonadales bacterium]|nr:HEAT repeat domain-containing protein [Gemmatimonadales bacterium]